ncbi:MAG TPA: primosomal protein N' [Pyrinomonadaceae bacterium]|nr:primosomal protein N' [Pyrinomonadaceae bacterium]
MSKDLESATHIAVAPATSSSAPLYAEVAVPLHVSKTFIYRLPADASDAQPGERILVPLGRTMVTGYIVGVLTDLPTELGLVDAEIKDADRVIDAVPICTPEILEITRWVAEYYASPLGEVIKSALPPGISPDIQETIRLTESGKTQPINQQTLATKILTRLSETGFSKRDSLADLGNARELAKALRELEESDFIERTQSQSSSFVKPKLVRFASLNSPLPETVNQKLTAAQQRVIIALDNGRVLPLQALLKEANVAAATVATLQRKRLLTVSVQAVRRDPFDGAIDEPATNHVLTQSQQAVLDDVEAALEKGLYAAFLLHGVTGSGKTEVYIRAMQTALDCGKSAMMLVPEIALTPVFSRRLRQSFGEDVAIFHSSLQRGERFDEWTRVKNGDARIVIGTRSAVFAPVRDLGLIVIDEEHEASYRQQDSPYYSGRDAAIVRAQKESAIVLLGSATPSLESFQNARNGKYKYLSLPERVGARPMASASIVDMRNVFTRHGKPRVFSDELLEAIQQTLDRKEQSIILLNRRGYSSFALCRSCGESVQCPNCDVTLTYHRDERVMICHYCNHREPVLSVCPNCGKNYIQYVGEGTQQLEEMLKTEFPDLRVARIDRDTTANRRRFEKSLKDFSEGNIDTLVGTQMLAKGHDFPNVTLVGVVSVDAGLALPDFRAAERTFQLITQVAGRAGRGDRPGKVLIQTYHPHHYALRHACAQDYEAFYQEEIRYRQNHSYPPFIAIASLLVHGPDLAKVRTDALELRKQLDAANQSRIARILGPAPAPLARLKGEHRFQLLIKSRSRRGLRAVADVALKAMSERGTNLRSINLEIDPVSMM